MLNVNVDFYFYELRSILEQFFMLFMNHFKPEELSSEELTHDADRILVMHFCALTLAMDQYINDVAGINKERRDYVDFQKKLHALLNS